MGTKKAEIRKIVEKAVNDRLYLSEIIYDKGIQQRADISEEHVDDLVAALKAGEKLPPVRVFDDEKKVYLSRGFHRYLAHQKAGIPTIPVEIVVGSRRDAILDSVGDNAEHNALRRSNADKRRAVMSLLQDEEWSAWSDREIARRCVVDHSYVSRLRKGLSVHDGQMSENDAEDNTDSASVDCPQMREDEPTDGQPETTAETPPTTRPRTVTRNGKTFQQNTANIGKSKPAIDQKTTRPAPAAKTTPDTDSAGSTPPQPTASSTDATDEPTPTPAQCPVDLDGNPIPDRADLRAAFQSAVILDEISSLLIQVTAKINRLVGDPNPSDPKPALAAARRLDRQEVLLALSNLKHELKKRPHAVCPFCRGGRVYQGAKCTGCREGTDSHGMSLGWVVKKTYEDAPADLRAALKKAQGVAA